MMDILHFTAEEIKLKVVRLLQQVESLEKKCKMLEDENQILKNKLEDQKNTIGTLEETNKLIKIAGTLDHSDENRALRKLVNGYIREIDECLRVLSNR
jgi:predicted RNase H-like nuclease (RuvC/YqgF family)